MHPDNWTESDVLDFIFSVDGTRPETLHGERFRGLSGSELCRLSLHEFVVRDRQHGPLIYDQLHSLLHRQRQSTMN